MTNWKIENLEYLSKNGFVFEVHYSVTATVGSGDNVGTGRVVGSVKFYEEDGDLPPGFIPYAELQEQTIIGWVKNRMGPATVAEIEAKVTERANESLNPKEESGLPWVVGTVGEAPAEEIE